MTRDHWAVEAAVDGDAFGDGVRRLRTAAGLRQVDLAAELGIGRSTLANIERNAEPPSVRVWTAIQDSRPDWVDPLRESYDRARKAAVSAHAEEAPPGDSEEPFLGGPFALVSVAYTYVFEESHSPSEIIEVRTVKALEAGAHCFGVELGHSTGTGFRVDQQALWGGHLTSEVINEPGRTLLWRRFEFDRKLRMGQRHEFAMRSWVERDPEPGTAVIFNVTLPANLVTINLAFHGSVRPAAAWTFGPVGKREEPGIDDPRSRRVKIGPAGVTARFRRPPPYDCFGLGWAW